ncbi:MAG: hypothetical protein DME55_14650, partial [Verrucomicrobia bacterium]
ESLATGKIFLSPESFAQPQIIRLSPSKRGEDQGEGSELQLLQMPTLTLTLTLGKGEANTAADCGY